MKAYEVETGCSGGGWWGRPGWHSPTGGKVGDKMNILNEKL